MTDLFQGMQRATQNVQHIFQSLTLPAIVTKSDETNNTCSILYVDSNGYKRNRDNVTVRLYGSGTDYFPKKDDVVTVQEDGDTCVVIARSVLNYAMDVQAKMKLTQDTYSDAPPAYGYEM